MLEVISIYIFLFFSREKLERLMDMFVELTVRRMGLGTVEGEAFMAYPDFKLVSLVVEHTLAKAWPEIWLFSGSLVCGWCKGFCSNWVV